jgi:hypothetical protein
MHASFRQLSKKKLIILTFILVIVILLIGVYTNNQKNSAVDYLTQQNCNSSSFASKGGTSSCSSGEGISIKLLPLGLGIIYSYQTLGNFPGTDGYADPAIYCGQPPTYKGKIITIFGKTFEFDSMTSPAVTPNGDIAAC